MKRDYEGVRKMKWDMLWHAIWINPQTKQEGWDRVTEKEAMKILKQIDKKT